MATIDPISIATQGYIIKEDPKVIFAITVGTLGYIKPEISDEEIIEVIRRVGGSGGMGCGRRKPFRKKKGFYDLKFNVTFCSVNGEELEDCIEDQKRFAEEFDDKNINVILTRIRNRGKFINVATTNIGKNLFERNNILIEKISVSHNNIIISSSFKKQKNIKKNKIEAFIKIKDKNGDEQDT